VQVGDRFKAKVEKLVFGGKGLIRHEGWVVFVADVIEGELVEVELTTKKKSYFEAALLGVVEPSKQRVKPPCPYFGTCGGCQMQHMDYAEQLRVKRQLLVDALRLESHIPVGATGAPNQWCYRRKVVLHGPEYGFFARDNTTIIPIERCLIFSERGFDEERAFLKRANLAPKRLTVLRDDQDNRTIDTSQIKERTIEGLRIFYSAAVFTQNDPDQALQIYKDVLENIGPEPVAELYCGIGIFSQLAAKKCEKVLGVELNPAAIKFAKQSSDANGIKNCTFIAKPCEKITKHECCGYKQWIVNPPRVGLTKEVIALIEREAPATLIYISCNPATLARDAHALKEQGYTIKKAQVYDMFAQTSHLETVVYFHKLLKN